MTKNSDFYTDAYLDGKDAAHAELRVWELGDHEPTCDCDPCETVRVIVEHVLLAPQTPVLLPDHHIERMLQTVWEALSVLVSRRGIVERSPRNRRQRAYSRNWASTPCQRLRSRKEITP